MYKAIIIDDEPKSISSIHYVLEKNCPQIEVVAQARSANEGFEKINALHPDIVFLDVEMPYESGFDLLARIEQVDFEVIFITAYEHFAVKAFKVNATDYILKPFTEQDIIAAVNKATERVQNNKLIHPKSISARPITNTSKRIAVPSFDGLVFLNVDDILRLEADDSYTHFHVKDKSKLVVCKPLSDYEELLTPFEFLRVHQSHLINLAYVQKYIKGRGGYLIMQDGSMVDVSARKKIEFLESLFK